MAEPLKGFFSRDLAARIGASIRKVHSAFNERAFIEDATANLDSLELIARARVMADALRKHLPTAYPKAIDILIRSLGSEHATDELEGVGMAPFFYMPHVIFVAECGLDHFDLSMQAQHELTRRFTCEFSIRPFIERYPEQTLATLARFAKDPSPHVRRLVSEGTRPRLPWASRVAFIDQNPERFVPLLEMLKDDPASVVRRSVANHLNDLTKTHPKIALDIARRWLKDASKERRALIAHALRSAMKRGDATALTIMGFGEGPRVMVEGAAFAPARVAIGDKTRVSFSVCAGKAKRTQSLAVDLVVHFVKARGQTSEKVFKLKTLELAPGERATFAKNISLAVHTTRKPNVGRHAVDALINGKRFPLGSFDVVANARVRRASR